MKLLKLLYWRPLPRSKLSANSFNFDRVTFLSSVALAEEDSSGFSGKVIGSGASKTVLKIYNLGRIKKDTAAIKKWTKGLSFIFKKAKAMAKPEIGKATTIQI